MEKVPPNETDKPRAAPKDGESVPTQNALPVATQEVPAKPSQIQVPTTYQSRACKANTEPSN